MQTSWLSALAIRVPKLPLMRNPGTLLKSTSITTAGSRAQLLIVTNKGNIERVCLDVRQLGFRRVPAGLCGFLGFVPQAHPGFETGVSGRAALPSAFNST